MRSSRGPTGLRPFFFWSLFTEVRGRSILRTSPCSTLAIWSCKTPHMLAALQKPLRLFAARSGTASAKSPRRTGVVLAAAFQEESCEGSQETYHHGRQGVGTKSQRLLYRGVESVIYRSYSQMAKVERRETVRKGSQEPAV